ncbi:DNA-binding protein [Brevibacillus laterosporus]|uniref:DNA-binding protein n=1 Tax=Brevibacillus laterosporus TaxID=1465 RepID=UPI000CE302A2|nr:DNA-binding protein [Brevibacillus laterosporus]MBG9800214.1 DNA-binding protein [Brevibacillus laterosporus]MCR8937881.1 DNA-binding protein [Brevibacillus laterosporus]MCZ0840520.1 DNA-binding protein [Brevibacillus laterosporus]MCZ0847426.1 DNA-binding protein [Brevibacillus laterosporus]MED1911250.1 DNA-binding protein [Brevibacillus laterosporus]
MTTTKYLVVRPIHEEVKDHLKSYNYTITKLSEITKINVGYLSSFLKGCPRWALTVDQLNAIGRAFEKPIGWLYDSYADEYFKREIISKKQVRAFLVTCAEIGRYDHIQIVLPRLLENPKYINVLFEVAEQLFYKGRQNESIYFYRLVIDNEKNKYKERFTMSHYRLFRILEKANTETLWKSVVSFEPFRKGLSKHLQLEALLQLGNNYRTLQRWEEVRKYADELIELANLVFKEELFLKKRCDSEGVDIVNQERHLVVYYGQGYLLKAESLEKQGLYEQAKEFLSDYTNLSQFELLGESGILEIDKFKKLTLINMCRLDILMGNTNFLDNFVELLEDHPDEILPSLLTITESANSHGFLIDTILKRFSVETDSFQNYHDSISVERHLQFRYQLAVYYFKNKRPNSGVKEILRGINLATVLNSSKELIRYVALFEAYRYLASSQQEREYKKILEDGQK